ncbi:MAG: helix-hairpin-helix domain-containing protein [Rhizobiaceae bacterium]|nr:helix-hairpin-helix domain-containing protein [Rhizobiaceae bacterium]
MKAKERLWLTADGAALVPDGSARAAKLYAAEGDEIPDSAAAMFGLVDGRIADTVRQEKRRKDGEDKRRAPGEDKNNTPQEKGGGSVPGQGASTAPPEERGQEGQKDDLTRIKGIGAKTEAALVAAGIDSFARLAAVDPDNAPDIGITPSARDWTHWQRQALAIHNGNALAGPADENPGLTVKTLKKED